MATIMKCYGSSTLGQSADGVYLFGYDNDAFGGKGEASFTTDKEAAMRFRDATHAFEVWRSTSNVRPTRPDGRPNRPLTALTVEFEECP